MQKYKIEGVQKPSGKEIKGTVTASSFENAKAKAEIKNIVVTKILDESGQEQNEIKKEKSKESKSFWSGVIGIAISICIVFFGMSQKNGGMQFLGWFIFWIGGSIMLGSYAKYHGAKALSFLLSITPTFILAGAFAISVGALGNVPAAKAVGVILLALSCVAICLAVGKISKNYIKAITVLLLSGFACLIITFGVLQMSLDNYHHNLQQQKADQAKLEQMLSGN